MTEKQDTPQKEPPGYYTIEQVATSTGLTKRTLRYYEEVGLLSPTDRTEGNYRRYTKDEVERIERIKAMRDLLGIPLNDIRKLMQAEDERQQIKVSYLQESDPQTRLVQLEQIDDIIHGQLQLIEQKIAGLEQMRHELLERLEKHDKKKQLLAQQSVQENKTSS